MQKLFFSILILTSTAYSAYAAEDAGFQQTVIEGPDTDRPLNIAIWYPTTAGQQNAVVGETPAFVGIPVVKDAAISGNSHPLVLISHGYGGSWRNLAWLATALATEGYIVVAPDHPGTTTFDQRPEEAVRLWKRPQDLSRVVDALSANPSFAGKIDFNRIAAVGHSLGGWTVAELAGARFDPGAVMENCMPRFGSVACRLFSSLGMEDGANATQLRNADLSDQRIRAVVTLDLGMARGFTDKSLAAIRTPILVIAAGSDIDLDVATKGKIAATNKDSDYLAKKLPPDIVTYEPIADALHFSFMQICKPGAAEMIEQETPGDGIVCKDGGRRDRQAIHAETLKFVSDFLSKAMPPA